MEGYRCHRDIAVDVGQLTVFIGANDAGKTGILDAIDFLINARAVSQDDFCAAPGAETDTIMVTGVFALTATDETAGRGPEGSTVTLRRVAGQDLKRYLEYLTKGFENDELNNLDELSNDRLEELVDENKLRRPQGRYLKDAKIQDLREWALQNAPMREVWASCPNNISDGLPDYLTFDADVELSADSGPLQTIFRQQARLALESERESADRLTQAISANLTDQEAALSEVVHQQMPAISHIHAIPRIDLTKGLTVDLQVEDQRGSRTPFRMRGHGVQRMILLAAYRMTGQLLQDQGYDRDIIWGFDEPEVFLHPGAQRLALTVINELVEWGLQAILATHSTVFVDKSHVESIVLLEQNDQGVSESRRLVSDDADAVNAFLDAIKAGVGLRNSDLFYENAFFIVEGATEANALPGLFKLYPSESLDGYSIRLIDAESASNATGLVEFLKDTGKPVVVLLDSDVQRPTSTAALSVKALQNRGIHLGHDIFFVGRDTFEDSFSDAVLAKSLHRAFGAGGPVRIAAKDISELRAKLGPDDKLVDLFPAIVGAAYVTYFRKTQLGTALAQVITNVNDIPAKVRDCFKRLRINVEG